jgi:hypothetical protein
MVCRTLTDKVFLARCRDLALDQRGFCLALDDDDLTQLVSDARTARETGRSAATDFPLLKARYDRLIT